MKLKSLNVVLVAGGLIVGGGSHVFSQSAPPPPRPFTVQNPDGTTQVVAPDRGPGRLSVKGQEVPTTADTGPKPFFRTDLSPRQVRKSGYYAGALLGLNVDSFQGNDFDSMFGTFLSNSPRVFGGGTDNNMILGPMAALKVGYVWPFGESIDQFENETGGIHLAGALEGEFLYFHSFHEVGPFGGGPTPKTDIQQITLAPMVNFLLKGAFGRSQIYGGFGVGVAMNFFESDGPAYPDRTSLGDFAYQWILGYEFHMNEDWAVFSEAKYFNVQDVDNVQGVGTSDMANVLVGIGVKRQL